MKKFFHFDPTQDQNPEDKTAAPKAAQPGLSRRGFLKAAAVTGVSAVVPVTAVTTGVRAAQAQAPHATTAATGPKLTNPIIPNFPGQYGSSGSGFQIPKRPLGNTGLQVSILGMGGFHLGTA